MTVGDRFVYDEMRILRFPAYAGMTVCGSRRGRGMLFGNDGRGMLFGNDGRGMLFGNDRTGQERDGYAY